MLTDPFQTTPPTLPIHSGSIHLTWKPYEGTAIITTNMYEAAEYDSSRISYDLGGWDWPLIMQLLFSFLIKLLILWLQWHHFLLLLVAIVWETGQLVHTASFLFIFFLFSCLCWLYELLLNAFVVHHVFNSIYAWLKNIRSIDTTFISSWNWDKFSILRSQFAFGLGQGLAIPASSPSASATETSSTQNFHTLWLPQVLNHTNGDTRVVVVICKPQMMKKMVENSQKFTPKPAAFFHYIFSTSSCSSHTHPHGTQKMAATYVYRLG